MFVCIQAPDAAALASSFSPWVESIGSITAVISLTPRQLAERLWERIPAPPAQVAVAVTVEAAILAAHNLSGCTFIAPGEETRVLGPLPVDCLWGSLLSCRRSGRVQNPPQAESLPHIELFEILDRWGIHTLAALARLPEADLSARLGERGVELQRLARGALSRPLRPETPTTIYEESAEFDHPIELREPLLFVIARFLHDLIARMRAQSLAAQAVHIALDQQKRTLGLPFPTLDLKLLIKLVEHSLERQPPEAPVERVYVALQPTRPRRVQHGLFMPATPEPEKLELTLGKIRALVGEKNVGYPELFDTHRPGAGKPAVLLPALAFRYFRPPLEARVETEAGVPKHLTTKMFRGRVVQIAGPWRSSGDWWRPNFWSSDEWDLALSDGALYRLVRNRAAQQWFVEGVYD
jgi:protein ImuB